MSTTKAANKTITSRIKSRGQVTLSPAILKAAAVDVDTALSVRVAAHKTTVPKGAIILEPLELKPRAWTKEDWAQKEAEADADIKAGQISKVYSSSAELIRDLRKGKLVKG